MSALARTRILDTGEEDAFDELTRLAMDVTSCPLAMIGFVDRERVWLKSAIGLARRVYPRERSPCDAALAAPQLVIGDVQHEPRVADHPLFTEAPYPRAYAGVRLDSPDGEPVGVLAVLDLRPRAFAEHALRALAMLARAVSAQLELRLLRDARQLKSEALLSSAQRIAGIGCWDWDVRTNEVNWSEEMFSIFQRPRDYVPHIEGFMERIHPDERESMKQKIADVIQHGRTTFPEYRIVWPDGSTRILAATAEVQRDREGVPLRLTGALQDVTEQRRVETERQQLATQMLRTQKLESLGVLAAGIAHDFNNLLVGMLGNAELAALDRTLSAQTRGLVCQVIEAASQAAGLTRQLLAYTGRRPFSMRNVDLNAHVQSLGSLLRASLPKSLKLRVELTSSLPDVCADLDQLQQVTMNLILNAAEAYEGREGEVFVRTFLQEFDEPPKHTLTVPTAPGRGAHVVLEVRDSASGMDAATLERIFEPFFSTKFTGRGLGLAAVLGIVRGHDAILSVDSTLGVGTTFRVYFVPVRSRDARVPRSEPAALDAPARADVLQNAGVLVVDDEPRVRAVARAILESADMRVIEAEDGERAIALFERRHSDIDVVLLDVIMPGPDAATVVRKLRAERASIPLVLYSGYPEDEATRLLRELDGEHSAFLEKPFSPAQLLDKLRAVLSGLG